MKLVKSTPPIFELEIDRDGTPTIIKVKALFWYDYDEEARADKLSSAVSMYPTYKSLEQWLGCFEFAQLDEWPAIVAVVECPLHDNDAGILEQMLRMGATANSPASRETILSALGWTSEGKRAFDRLKEYGYVNAMRSVGYYLTQAGIERAKSLLG